MLDLMVSEFKILNAYFTIYFKNGSNISIFCKVSFKNSYVEFGLTPQNFTILGN